MNKSRAGVNALLVLHPNAYVAKIEHQNLVAEMHQNISHDRPWYLVPAPGPWTSVTLYEDGKFIDFAIWNLTGNVYDIDNHGAVADDPFIWVTPREELMQPTPQEIEDLCDQDD